jgi:hypothetical protein
MEYGGTSHNRTVYASPPVGGSGFRSARSLRSHASLHPPFVGPGLCYAKPLFGPPKRRKQPKRYTQCQVNLFQRHRVNVSGVYAIDTVESRNVFIDNVKGVLIFLVVLGHVIGLYMYENFGLFMLWAYIYCFHMPLFVYISGFLSKDPEKIQRKAFRRFLLPYLVWNSFAYILTALYYGKLEFSFYVHGP